LSISPASAPRQTNSAFIRATVRAHTRRVALLRWALPAAIGSLLIFLAAFVVAQALRDAAAQPKETPTLIRMVSPHFIGRDDLGREYNLTARVAVRDDADLQRVRLTSPVLVLYSADPRPKKLTADHGIYDEDTRLLRLTGHVRGDDSNNARLGSDEALVDTRAGTVTGMGPITGENPRGSIQANSYTANENGLVVMRGGVHARLSGK
jgi:LPS export ABC transporter protein LptC